LEHGIVLIDVDLGVGGGYFMEWVAEHLIEGEKLAIEYEDYGIIKKIKIRLFSSMITSIGYAACAYDPDEVEINKRKANTVEVAQLYYGNGDEVTKKEDQDEIKKIITSVTKETNAKVYFDTPEWSDSGVMNEIWIVV